MEGLFLLLWCLHCCWRCNLIRGKGRGMFWGCFLVIHASDVGPEWVGGRPRRRGAVVQHMHLLHSSRDALGQTFLPTPSATSFPQRVFSALRASGPLLSTGSQRSAPRRPWCLLSAAKRGCFHSQGRHGPVLYQSGAIVTVRGWGKRLCVLLSALLRG